MPSLCWTLGLLHKPKDPHSGCWDWHQVEEIDKDQINVWWDIEWAKKEAERDRRTACACKSADLESGQLNRDRKEGREGGRELSRFLGDVGAGKVEIRCKCPAQECICGGHGTRRKPTSMPREVYRSLSSCPRELDRSRVLGHSQDSDFEWTGELLET